MAKYVTIYTKEHFNGEREIKVLKISTAIDRCNNVVKREVKVAERELRKALREKGLRKKADIDAKYNLTIEEVEGVGALKAQLTTFVEEGSNEELVMLIDEYWDVVVVE